MRIALGIEYHGTQFYGWQRQHNNLPTIQQSVEEALTKIADEPITVFCAGRTDAGVHALGQVIHFDTHSSRILRAWMQGTNTHLPNSIAVRFAEEVDDQFHARFSALSRRYRYVIYNHSLRPALFSHLATWYYLPLNEKKMQLAANFLLGEQDFSSFRSSECESKTPMRNVHEVKISRQGDWVIIEIEANAFLHHMVRNIVGVLFKIGSGFYEPDWMHHVLQAKDRKVAATTAPPDGLYLAEVTYPKEYNFSRFASNRMNGMLLNSML